MSKYSVAFVEEMIMCYDNLPEGLHGWRRYRIEYGGHAELCEKESIIYLPPNFDVDKLELDIYESAPQFYGINTCIRGSDIDPEEED